MSKKSKKGKVTSTKAKVTKNKKVAPKKVAPKKERKVDPKKVAKVKDKAKKREAKNNIPAPEKLMISFDGVANPIVESSRKKRALAVALAMCEKDDDRLATLVRASGIPFKQVNGKTDAKHAELLNKSEWSGKSYAGWARFQLAEGDYAEKQKDAVDSCMEFAKALAKGYKE